MLSPSLWLDDDIIACAQFLLKEKFPHIAGLEPVVLAQSLAMSPAPNSELVQILNTNGNHWMVVSTVGCPANTISVYDSMNLPLSSYNKKVVADLMHSKEKEFTVQNVQVQYQCGGSDCGVFAIAFAMSLCAGENPGTILYRQEYAATYSMFGEIYFPRRESMQRVEVTKLPIYCVCRLSAS